jgi:hypothetical protein
MRDCRVGRKPENGNSNSKHDFAGRQEDRGIFSERSDDGLFTNA